MENEIRLSDEVREAIKEQINEECNRAFYDMDSDYWKVRKLSDDIFSIQNKLNERMQQIESMVSQHAIGVQNVYSEITEVNKLLDTRGIKDLLVELTEMKSQFSIDNMHIKIRALKEMSQGTEFMKVLEDFERIKEKICEIFNIDYI
jgi:EAL domain-containing protein (putative c-di-GMP-specific phosphodiesterase class I)